MAFFRLFLLQADWTNPFAALGQGVILAAIMAASLLSGASAADRTPVNLKTIVFVCEHGSVRSVVAAAHFNRIARERGLPYVAVSRGINIDDRIPARVRDGLARDGLAPVEDAPHALGAEEAGRAAQVIAFDTVPAERSGGAEVTYWKGLASMKDYDAGRAAIVEHIEEAADALTEKLK
jgi:protein-tyrosine-phosphatase